MQNVLLQFAMKRNKSRRQRQWWQYAVRTLVALVVFCTTHAFCVPNSSPGLTLNYSSKLVVFAITAVCGHPNGWLIFLAAE